MLVPITDGVTFKVAGAVPMDTARDMYAETELSDRAVIYGLTVGDYADVSEEDNALDMAFGEPP